MTLILLFLSIGSLVYLAVKTVYVHYLAYKKQQKLGGKWAGYLSHVSGISLRASTPCFLFLNADKDLVIDDRQSQLLIAKERIRRVAVLEAALLSQLYDGEIAELMDMKSHPALHAMRIWLSRNPEARHHFMLILYLDEPLEEKDNSAELVFFSDWEAKGHLKELLRQPEIAVKALYIPKGSKIDDLYPSQAKTEKIKRKNFLFKKKEKALSAREIAGNDTEPFGPLS